MLKVRIVVSKVSRQLLQACTSSGQLSDPSRKLLTATKSKPCTDKPEARASALKRSTSSRSAALVTVALKQLGLADLKICLPITKKRALPEMAPALQPDKALVIRVPNSCHVVALGLRKASSCCSSSFVRKHQGSTDAEGWDGSHGPDDGDPWVMVWF